MRASGSLRVWSEPGAPPGTWGSSRPRRAEQTSDPEQKGNEKRGGDRGLAGAHGSGRTKAGEEQAKLEEQKRTRRKRKKLQVSTTSPSGPHSASGTGRAPALSCVCAWAAPPGVYKSWRRRSAITALQACQRAGKQPRLPVPLRATPVRLCPGPQPHLCQDHAATPCLDLRLRPAPRVRPSCSPTKARSVPQGP